MLLRTRIIAFTSIGILAVVMIMALANYNIQSSAQTRFEHTSTQAKQVLWNKIIAGEQQYMEESISSLTRDRQLRKALKAENYDAIQEQALTSYRRLSTSTVLDRIDIADTQGTVKFSAPESTQGWENNPLIQAALDSGKISKGIVLLNNEPFIQMSFPLNFRGKLIGIGIYSKKLSQAIAEFKELDKSEVGILQTDSRLALSTAAKLYQQMTLKVPDDKTSQFLRIDTEDKALAVSLNPILNPEKKLIAYLATANDQTTSYQIEDRTHMLAITLSLILIAAIIFAFMVYIRRSFEPVNQVVNSLQNIAEGNLNVQLNNTGKDDEIGQLTTAAGTMAKQLKEIINQVRSMATQLQEAIRAMDDIVEETDLGVQQQLQETRRVNDAITEMSASVSQVAEHANAAANNASTANTDALEGERIVQQSIESIEQMSSNINHSARVINQLDESSQEIGSVLDVIRGIAEQTNLLALNAAIEAARAGEQGRGFAVVADEVRTLASRTQKSTQDIQDTIEQLQAGSRQAVESMEKSIEQVSENLKQSQKTSDSLSTIAQAIDGINNMNTQIAEATDSQSHTTQEISSNVHSINGLAEKSAKGARETSACTAQLNHMAGDLTKLVAHFQI
ncbi:methyl-accepting chemotaxis protein [Pseudoteredinibacter isoporae]|uniref:Methyl-accepting chemotaxis protein n=1 Tax=Pseudoteredinibacter isoporae TaxID=570281 RepID=A0A7X0JTU6_9GAMM|nr:methyl-accepting chemotaxis protein [Pseudoteredinibacter isoporae]MBB6522022.1 methyl-accepting chemotaxis protein [Pseudoteredinibacter isoporae]NHO87558.1 methyl-accepting chemotaxis protein [Pseudoteredinibacter isoporae]NIB24111.1 methyl-accepting chemotaxis protein [Pseudoteredinibacter isoporae]